jgi:hypothetical protein
MYFLVRFLLLLVLSETVLVLVLDCFLRYRIASEPIAWFDSSISSIAAHSKAERRAIWKNRLRRWQRLKSELKNEQNVSIAPSPRVY